MKYILELEVCVKLVFRIMAIYQGNAYILGTSKFRDIVFKASLITRRGSPDTAKPSVDLKRELLNNRACVLIHCLITSPNLQLNSGAWPGASCPLMNSLIIENKALLPGDK